MPEGNDDDVRTTNPFNRLLNRGNPFAGVFEHARKVTECVRLLEEGFDRYLDGRYDDFTELTDRVAELETEADDIKSQVRTSLPNLMFMPVDKGDVEELIHLQDEIPDQVENLMEMMDARPTPIPGSLETAFRNHARLVIETVAAYEAAVEEFHDVLDSGFGGTQREEGERATTIVHELENEADKHRYEMVREIYAMEDELDPMDEYHLLKITDWVDNIADQAENAADKIRVMVAR